MYSHLQQLCSSAGPVDTRESLHVKGTQYIVYANLGSSCEFSYPWLAKIMNLSFTVSTVLWLMLSFNLLELVLRNFCNFIGRIM